MTSPTEQSGVVGIVRMLLLSLAVSELKRGAVFSKLDVTKVKVFQPYLGIRKLRYHLISD